MNAEIINKFQRNPFSDHLHMHRCVYICSGRFVDVVLIVNCCVYVFFLHNLICESERTCSYTKQKKGL